MEVCTNIIGDLTILRTMNMKPNYSDLSRKYGIDRHTIAKYYKDGGKKVTKRNNKSKFDKYYDEIKNLLSEPGVTKMAAFQYLKGKYAEFPDNYNSFKSFTLVKEIIPCKSKALPHVRFETDPGDQLQVDWKESLKMTTIDGNEIEFNVYTATLGFSRFHQFIYTKTKTTEDFIRCTIESLRGLGGTPKHILTDNMTAIAIITNGHKEKNYKIKQFEKDIGIKIKLCKCRSPETKGKDESANRFMNWLLPYNNKFKDEQELIEIIKRINNQANSEVNRTTSIPPLALFLKEKEYLNQLPNKLLLETYIEGVLTQVVPSTLLVNYHGSGYSVPMKFINKRVKLYPIDNKLYIYYNDDLVIIHTISNKKINYDESHYNEALKARITHKADDEINEMASANLARFDKI